MSYSHTKSRALQWIGIILIIGVFVGAYWYFQVRASTLNQSQNDLVTNGLVGLWSFNGDDISGTTAYDRSGSGNNGTLTGGPVATKGKIGQALAFDGSSSRVALTDNAVFDVGGAGSWCNWFYSTTNQSARGMFSHNVSGSSYVMISGYLSSSSGILSSYVRVAGNAYTATSPTYASGYWNNEWHFVCTTFDKALSSQRLKLYVDGNLLATHDAANGDIDAGNLPVVGNWMFAGDYETPFQGYLDDVRMYNRALTAGEIQSLYGAGGGTKTNSAVSNPQGTGRLDSGLAGYWKMDDGSGTSATDSSTNGNTGTLTNGPTWTTGQIGGAVNFDGTDDYITAGDQSLLETNNSLAMGGWFKLDTLPSGNRMFLISKGGTTSYYEYEINVNGTNSNKIRFAIYAIGGGAYLYTDSVTVPTTGTWFHVLGVFDKNALSVKVYFNGNLEGTSTTTSGTIESTRNSNFNIGKRDDNAETKLDGLADEVRIYNRILSADEVAQLYRLTAPTDVDTGLKGYWSFDGQDMNGSTTAYDRSGAGNTGTLTNGPTRAVGKVGQALSFDGGNDQVDIANTSNGITNYNTSRTVATWFKMGAINKWNPLVSTGNSTNETVPLWLLSVNSSNVLTVYHGGNYRNGTTALVANQWYFASYTYNTGDNTAKLYLNGNVEYSGTVADTSGSQNRNSLYIGVNLHDRMNGSLDEVRIYNRALSAAEIKVLYDAGADDKMNSSVSQPQGTGRLDSDLAAYWKLDDGSGTNATDSSGNGNTGALANGPAWVTGQIENALDFDGTNDVVTVSDANSLDVTGTLTLSAWINPDTYVSSGNYRAILNKGTFAVPVMNYSLDLYGSGASDQRLTFSYYAGGSIHQVRGATNLSTGSWKHVAVVYDDNANDIRLFIDGAPESFSITLGDPKNNSLTANDYGIEIGRYNGNDRYFDGKFDEIRLYRRALSDVEIGNLYRLSSPTATDTSLKSYWSFNGQDMNGTTAYDRSGAGNNGTLVNGPTRTIGKIGQALSFDGSNDSMTTCITSTSKTYTFSFWMNRSNTLYIFDNSANRLIIDMGNNAPTSGALSFYDGTWKSIGSAISTNEWHHIVLVLNNATTTATGYVDGASIGTAAYTGMDLGCSSAQTIGSDFAGNTNFQGKLDEFRIYDRALSVAEVAALYNQSR